jgi:hypothetical protein
MSNCPGCGKSSNGFCSKCEKAVLKAVAKTSKDGKVIRLKPY